ncbi:dGTP triphosphohydrolase [Ruminococcus sp.]|uniref:dGTP triphosphohydrolase n=1 Tax=Ruminococcus sp. TaxID=41978 RepID=UPI001B528151|nr:dNTP triphosphohydrolase [Ruminococcus sp.]MBP5431394.1 dNTP triphosphohydrolase [Ruminococcus sp.]
MKNDKTEIIRYKNEIDESYASILADYAVKSAKPNSRVHEEKVRDKENRSDFQRDRDRIIHSAAFRRLMYKTQVFVNHEGDYFRTRLTHTLEVAQISRGICKSLALNEELAEAIALGHDIGHTPFGHAVEGYLDDEMKRREMTGFLHNEQSVRVVDLLEKRCSEYAGLNLTYEVREGILKHNSDRSGIYQSLNSNEICSTLEGQIVGLVDTVAYICHDLQDGIISGLVEKAYYKNNDFQKDIKRIETIVNTLLDSNEQLNFSRYSDTFFIDKLIHHFVMAITKSSAENIKNKNIKNRDDVEKAAKKGVSIIEFSKEDKEIFKDFKKLIYKSVYGINTIEIMDSKAKIVAKELFEAFSNNPKLLPPDEYFKYLHCNDSELEVYDGYKNNELRVICDYIASMTDRFALEEHERITNPRIRI